MTCSLRIERTDGFRLSLTFDGPVELGAALAQVVARFEAGEPVDVAGGAPPSVPVSTPKVAGTGPRGGRSSTKRSQDRRDRIAAAKRNGSPLHATGNATNATLHATGPVAVAPASPSGSLPSLSPAFASSHGEKKSARNRCNDATATDATWLPVAPIDLDAPMSAYDWAAGRVESLRMHGGLPASFDVPSAWMGYVGHVARECAEGRPRRLEAGGWQKWLADQVRYDRNGNGNRGRVVQRDPPGPKAYRQAKSDDPWDDEEKTA